MVLCALAHVLKTLALAHGEQYYLAQSLFYNEVLTILRNWLIESENQNGCMGTDWFWGYWLFALVIGWRGAEA